MADETATLNWVRDNITSVSVSAPATAITTALVIPDDRISIPTDGRTKWIGVWREPAFHAYTPANLSAGYYDEFWRLGVFALFHYNAADIYSIDGLAQQRIGYAWRDAFVNWISDNETLGGNAWNIGDGEAQFYIDPFTPSPPWLKQNGWGTHLVIPIQNIRD